VGFLTDILSQTLFRSTNRQLDRLLEDARRGKPLPKATPDSDSGVLSLKDSTLSYASPVYGTWQVPLGEIIVFGEYTTDNGPHIDDWFMVFVTKDFNWVEASNYCAGSDAVRNELARQWGVESLHGKLWRHTDFASRVIWPLALADQPLFEFVERPQTIGQKFKSFGIGLIDKDLTQPVKTQLQAAPTR
jgi:hypothetical protein